MSDSTVLQIVRTIILHGLERFGRFYSVYAGFVLDNKDATNQNRLILKVPQVTGENTLKNPAYPRGNYAGKGYGIQNLPAVGDMVKVSFEYGKPDFPMWEHGHWGTNEMPNDDNLRNPLNHWFISPTGHRVEFDDNNNQIKITHKDGTYLLLSNDSTTLNVAKDVLIGSPQAITPIMLMGDTQMQVMQNIVKGLQANTDMIQSAVAYTSLFVPNPSNVIPIGLKATSLAADTLKNTAAFTSLMSSLSSLPAKKGKSE